ncbi:DUF6404 family protein [Enterovibrio calviensis]|uniref:DUF6404 family protein n=1 Tax=Enterovibrio calviensis TaxID=91359 RepID=UPI000484B502|nr:DUF6404 family protein [Enterovibrio calviensis]
MEKAEFIQKHLIEKGVPADLTKSTAFIWSRYKDPSQKPLVFQSPAKILITRGLFMGLLWGALMWVFFWHSEPNSWVTYLVSVSLFGVCMGFIDVFRTIKARKLLGETNWETWCQQHYK